MHPAFGRLMTGHVVNVMPLAAGELEAAALGPALRVGVTFERGLLAALIGEVSGQPNALPLFQYTLTELFDRRQDSTLTQAAYRGVGRDPGGGRQSCRRDLPGSGSRAARGRPPVVPAAGHRRPGLRDPPGRGRLGAGHARCRHRRRCTAPSRPSWPAGSWSATATPCRVPSRWRSPMRRCSASGTGCDDGSTTDATTSASTPPTRSPSTTG